MNKMIFNVIKLMLVRFFFVVKIINYEINVCLIKFKMLLLNKIGYDLINFI